MSTIEIEDGREAPLKPSITILPYYNTKILQCYNIITLLYYKSNIT